MGEKLTRGEKRELSWLAQQTVPMWGGHLRRGDPVPLGIRVFLDAGLIERVDYLGYRITPAGRSALLSPGAQPDGQ